MAVALVIFARWDPLRCFGAALLFGAAGALGPSLQSVGITQGYYFFNAAPYVADPGHHDRARCSPKHARLRGDARRARSKSAENEARGGLAHERIGWPEQVAERRRHRPRAAAVAGGRDAGRLAAQTAKIVAHGRQGAAQHGDAWISWSSPNTRCTACRWTRNPEIMCTLDGPEVAAFKAACNEQRDLGLLLDHGAQPGRQSRTTPASSSTIKGDAEALLSQDAPLGAGRAVGAGRPRHPGDRGAEGLQDRADHLP